MRPPGWQEDNRTYMLLRAQGLKDRPETVFHSLNAVKNNTPEKSHGEKIKSSGLFQMMLAAAAKNKSDWNPT